MHIRKNVKNTPELLAMQIHQQFGHAPFQKIKSSLGNKNLHRSVEAPISDISQSVLAALQNLHCEHCQLAKKNQIQHPKCSRLRRSKDPFQIVYVDMCYNPYYTEIRNSTPSEKLSNSLKTQNFKILRHNIDKALESN